MFSGITDSQREDKVADLDTLASCTEFYRGSLRLICLGFRTWNKLYTLLIRFLSQATSSRWQVDKEAISLSRVRLFYRLCLVYGYTGYQLDGGIACVIVLLNSKNCSIQGNCQPRVVLLIIETKRHLTTTLKD